MQRRSASQRTAAPFALALLAGTVAPRSAEARVELQAHCGGRPNNSVACDFTNISQGHGSGCATLVLVSRAGMRLPAPLACSRVLAPNEVQTVPVALDLQAARQHCDGALSSCAVQVEMSDVHERPDARGFFKSLLWLIVLGSAVWVYFDTRRLGIRKGLVPGLADLNPIGWAIATAGIWIVAFPVYLLNRQKLANAAQAAGFGPLQSPVLLSQAGPGAQAHGHDQAPPGFGHAPPGYGQQTPPHFGPQQQQQPYGPPQQHFGQHQQPGGHAAPPVPDNGAPPGFGPPGSGNQGGWPQR